MLFFVLSSWGVIDSNQLIEEHVIAEYLKNEALLLSSLGKDREALNVMHNAMKFNKKVYGTRALQTIHIWNKIGCNNHEHFDNLQHTFSSYHDHCSLKRKLLGNFYQMKLSSLCIYSRFLAHASRMSYNSSVTWSAFSISFALNMRTEITPIIKVTRLQSALLSLYIWLLDLPFL